MLTGVSPALSPWALCDPKRFDKTSQIKECDNDFNLQWPKHSAPVSLEFCLLQYFSTKIWISFIQFISKYLQKDMDKLEGPNDIDKNGQRDEYWSRRKGNEEIEGFHLDQRDFIVKKTLIP